MQRKDHPSPLRSAARRMIGRWVGWVERHAVAVMVAAIIATVAAFGVAAGTIRINTDTEDMLSDKLAFRQLDEEQRAAFPQHTNILLAVLDGPNADANADAAAALARRLTAREDVIESVFHPASDPFFRKNGLLFKDVDDLAELTDSLAASQPLLARLSADPTLRGFLGVLGMAFEHMPADDAGARTLADVLDRMAAVAVAQSEGRPGALSWRQLLNGEQAGEAKEPELVLIQPVLDHGSLQPAGKPIAAIRAAAADLGLAESGVRLRLTGAAALEQEEMQSVESNMGLIGLLSFLLVAALLFVGLRSPRLGLATLATLVIGLVWTAGFAALAIGHLNLLSVAFAVLFIGLSVDFGIHFGLRAKEGADRGGEPRSALRWAGESVGGALALSALMAAIGFFSFVPTAYVGLAELGVIAGVGMVIALFANLTVLPALLTLMPLPRNAPQPLPGGRAAAALGRRLRRHSGPVAAFALVLGAAATLALPHAKFDFDPMNLRDPETESVRTLLDLTADSQTNPYAITILARDLETARAMKPRLEALPEVAGVVTVDDLVPADQEEKLEIIADARSMMLPVLTPEPAPPETDADRRAAFAGFQARLYEAATGDGPLAAPAARLAAAFDRMTHGRVVTDAALRELERRLLAGLPGRLAELRESLSAAPVTLAGLPEDLKRRMIAPDGRARIQVLPEGNMRDQDQMRAFVAAVRTVAPQATGAPVVIMEAGDAVVTAFWQASATALTIISLLLLAILRSLRDTLLVLVPLGLAGLMTVASSVLLGMSFNFANVIVLPLLLGLGVANGIHFVLRSREIGGQDPGAVLATSTPRAVVFSALTTIASFGSLALSDHRGTASMGVLLSLALAYTLIATLVILPTLASWLRQKGGAAG